MLSTQLVAHQDGTATCHVAVVCTVCIQIVPHLLRLQQRLMLQQEQPPKTF